MQLTALEFLRTSFIHPCSSMLWKKRPGSKRLLKLEHPSLSRERLERAKCHSDTDQTKTSVGYTVHPWPLLLERLTSARALSLTSPEPFRCIKSFGIWIELLFLLPSFRLILVRMQYRGGVCIIKWLHSLTF